MTDLRNSQTLGEVWITDTTRMVTSQTTLEAWVTRLPVAATALIVSQALIEAWITNTPIQVIVSQALTEVWTKTGGPPPLRVSSQLV